MDEVDRKESDNFWFVEWQLAVANAETLRGFADWRAAKLEEASADVELLMQELKQGKRI